MLKQKLASVAVVKMQQQILLASDFGFSTAPFTCPADVPTHYLKTLHAYNVMDA